MDLEGYDIPWLMPVECSECLKKFTPNIHKSEEKCSECIERIYEEKVEELIEC